MKIFWGSSFLIASVFALLAACAPLPWANSPQARSSTPAFSQHAEAYQVVDLDWVDQARQREVPVRLYLPKGSSLSKPVPLVISLHGAGHWGAAQREITRWDAVADREGFVVVYPSGGTGSGPRVWRAVTDGPAPTQDVVFISDLIDKLSADYNIDPARIYANGVSNGAGMSLRMAELVSNPVFPRNGS